MTLDLGNSFLDMTPKAQATKEKKIDKFNIKVTNYYVTKDTIKKIKKTHRTGEPICKS